MNPLHSRFSRHAAFSLSLLGGPLVMLGGCWSTTPATTEHATLAAAGEPLAISWPPRDPARAEKARAETPRAVDLPLAWHTVDLQRQPSAEPVATAPASDASAASPAPTPTDEPTPPRVDTSAVTKLGHVPDFSVSHAELHGQGLLRVINANKLEFAFDTTPDGGVKVRGNVRTVDSMLRFVSFSTLPNRPAALGELLPLCISRASHAMLQVAAELSNRPDDALRADNARVLWEGLAMHMLRPKLAPGAAFRGLIVHLGGSNTGEIERRFLDDFVAQGWIVLSMPYVGVPGGNSTRFVLQPRPGELPPEAFPPHQAATTVPYLSPINFVMQGLTLPGAVEVIRDPDQLGERIAAVVDDRIAEAAYSVEAALDYLAKAEPDLVKGPCVLMGCSAGALVAPAVAARLPGRFSAAVLVGGATNILDVAFRSTLDGVAPSVEWAKNMEVSDQKRVAVESYLRHARLDPDKTAAALRGVPTLMLHATFDTIVPSDHGRDLWEKLGRPQRRNLLGGHLGLFLLLPDESAYVSRWLDEHAR